MLFQGSIKNSRGEFSAPIHWVFYLLNRFQNNHLNTVLQTPLRVQAQAGRVVAWLDGGHRIATLRAIPID